VRKCSFRRSRDAITILEAGGIAEASPFADSAGAL
jgi:hypothetical protein